MDEPLTVNSVEELMERMERDVENGTMPVTKALEEIFRVTSAASCQVILGSLSSKDSRKITALSNKFLKFAKDYGKKNGLYKKK